MLKYLELVREWFGKVKVFRGKNVSEKKRKKREKKRKEKERGATMQMGVLYFWGAILFCGLEVELLGCAIPFFWGVDYLFVGRVNVRLLGCG